MDSEVSIPIHPKRWKNLYHIRAKISETSRIDAVFANKIMTQIRFFSHFHTTDMFSKYVWHVHNDETLLKLFSGILSRQLRTSFEIIAQM